MYQLPGKRIQRSGERTRHRELFPWATRHSTLLSKVRFGEAPERRFNRAMGWPTSQ
jgi:hypothetical protein